MEGGSYRNWSGTVRCAPRTLAAPESEGALRDLVRETARRGGSLRPVGSGHSHTALVASDDTLVSLEGMTGLRDHDTPARTARIGAGTVLADLGPSLRALGLAMHNLGDVDVQTLAGALSTGTHGTGRRLGGLATAVEALRLVTANGDVVSCSAAEEPEIFDASRVSLGALGIVSEVTLALLPTYRLHEKVSRHAVDETVEAFDGWADTHRHCEFFWLPGKDVCEVKRIDPSDRAPDPLPDRPYERIDHSDRVLPSERSERFVELEYAVPASRGLTCFREIRDLMQRRYQDVLWPVEVRTLAEDAIPLSTAHGRPTMTVSIHQGNELPYEAFFRDAEEILRDHEGRPHWGKWHTLGATELALLYPQWDDFLAVRASLDPGGVFLNAHLRDLFEP